MWTFHQRTGNLIDPEGDLLATGFSGYGEFRNDPDYQDKAHIGCIPRGKYTIGKAYTSKTGLGNVVMNLEPFASNEMFGRSLFRFHGYAVDKPETQVNESLLSSHGCCCFEKRIRLLISQSEDRVLEVVE